MSEPTTNRSARVAAGREGSGPGALRMPSGRLLDCRRSRWVGILDAEEMAFCRENGVELAFDCAQIGWVPAACVDDAPPVRGEEPVHDLTAHTSPEQDARRLLTTLGAQLERLRSAHSVPASTAAAIAQLRTSLATRIAEFRARHGVVAASRCHLAANARLAAAEPPRDAPTLQEEEFTFRPWTHADAPHYRAMLDNPRLWEFLPESYPEPLTDDTALALIELGNIDARQEAFAVVRDGEPVGQCLLRYQDPFAGMRVAEVAYWLAVDHWSKGWMSRILPAFVERSFTNTDVDVLEAWIHEDHAASARVAERSGFQRDSFAFEGELAAALSKPRTRRFVLHRGRRTPSRPPTPSRPAASADPN